MKIVIDPSTAEVMKHFAIGGQMSGGTDVPGGGVLIDLDRDVIQALFEQVPVGDSWDEVIRLLVLSKKPRGES